MKSGLLMSRPSAIQATFTPVPATMFCACGVELLSNAVLVTCRASGWSSGWLGSLGHVVLCGVDGVGPVPAENAGPAVAPLSVRSGNTPATDGSLASWFCWVWVTVAEK